LVLFSKKELLSSDRIGTIMIKVYGDSASGNCLKIKYIADYLAVPYEWIETSVIARDTRTPEFLAINPAGQVPVVTLADGRVLSQSAAILLHLAEGSALIPADAYDRAVMFQFMFWEQYSHETAIAVRRFHKHLMNKSDDAIDPALLTRGHAALTLMEQHLTAHEYFAGGALSLADIALVAYTRLAPEGGFDLSRYPNLRRWIARIEAALGLPALA
jgi:glutathione S-transferase